MGLFAWSIPFVCEKVTEMLYHMMNSTRPLKHPIKPIQEAPPTLLSMPKSTLGAERVESEILRNKVKCISRMIRIFKTLRQENEDILKLKGLCPDNKIPRGVLLQGITGIKDAIQHFANAKQLDIPNEKRPDS